MAVPAAATAAPLRKARRLPVLAASALVKPSNLASVTGPAYQALSGIDFVAGEYE